MGENLLAQEKLLDYSFKCPAHILPGDTLQLIVFIDINDGYHINSTGNLNNAVGIPTDLEFFTPLPKGLEKLGNAKITDKEGNDFGPQIEGKGIRLVQSFRYNKLVSQKELLIKGLFKYQVCDAQFCYSPEEIPFDFKIQILETNK